jgi:hypothetical protein
MFLKNHQWKFIKNLKLTNFQLLLFCLCVMVKHTSGPRQGRAELPAVAVRRVDAGAVRLRARLTKSQTHPGPACEQALSSRRALATVRLARRRCMCWGRACMHL